MARKQARKPATKPRSKSRKAPKAPRRSRKKVIAAEEFQLVDANGKLRGLFCASDGYPTLSLFDRNQLVRIALQVEPNGRAVISVMDESGRSMVGLGADPANNGAGISVHAYRGESMEEIGLGYHFGQEPELHRHKYRSGSTSLSSESRPPDSL